MAKHRIGTWMYKNGGGDQIQETLTELLRERDIEVVSNLNLARAVATKGEIICNGIAMEELDAFFSYNAGKQTQYQICLLYTSPSPRDS